ncbi:hypothetical protein THAOC_22733, partial [Thalassiosira oceanica]
PAARNGGGIGRGGTSIEDTVLQSNPVLGAFGNTRMVRNDNSSRFGKYIDVSFTASGRLDGAAIDTYLLEKVRLDGSGRTSGPDLGLDGLGPSPLLSRTGVCRRRDGADDACLHAKMRVDCRAALLHCDGNLEFVPDDNGGAEGCRLIKDWSADSACRLARGRADPP